MRAITAVGCALALLASPAGAQPAPFTDAEVRALVAHGPWPAPYVADPSNPASGNREAIELGEKLFFEERLSASGRFSCGTCHVPERSWTDNQTRGSAAAEVERNTPTLMNMRLGRRFGWDGAAETLAAQAVRPILDQRELGATPAHVAKVVRADDQLSCRYRKAFGAPPSPGNDKAVLDGVGKALAAFVETLESPPVPFDRFRNALARGEPIPSWIYPESAQRGAKLFVGKANCNRCHEGPNFTQGELKDNGFSKLSAPGRRDPGREGRFKVPTLRHLLVTAPYGHQGQVETLAEVVRHYSERGSAEVAPMKLTALEQSDLVVFLQSLSSFSNPWRPEAFATCH